MDEAQSFSKKILLAEDDQFLSTLLKNRLEREGGFQVYAAHSGEEALKAIETFKPDLVLLDIIMPGKTGFEVLEEMQAKPGVKPPVIIISNLGQDIDIQRGRELGVVDYFVKARTSIDDLINNIRVIFEG